MSPQGAAVGLEGREMYKQISDDTASGIPGAFWVEDCLRVVTAGVRYPNSGCDLRAAVSEHNLNTL